MLFVLRPYQLEAIEKIRELIKKGQRRIILQMDTGAGKTGCACGIMKMVVDKGNQCLFLAGARELVSQASDKLQDFGVHHGIIMAGHGYTPAAVQIASKDTLNARGLRSQKIELPPASVIICDEAHLSTSKNWQQLLAHYPNAIIIGTTATPCRSKGQGLGNYYQGIVQVIQRSGLIQQGFIVPTVAYAPYIPNLKAKKGEKALASNGDYREDFIAKRMDRPTLVGDIVRWWKKLGRDLPTFFFGSSVAHSIHVRDEFRKAGISAEHIEAESDENFRRDLLGTSHEPGAFGQGQVKVLCNYGILGVGVDQPCCGCVIMGRPTKSFIVYKQSLGRSVRPYAGPLYTKKEAIFLDHAGVVYEHGLPDDDITWRLDSSRRAHDRAGKEPGEAKPPQPIACPKCATLFTGTNQCPNCHYVVEKKKRQQAKENKDGVLVKISKEDVTSIAPDQKLALARLWHKCLAVASARDLTPRHAAYHFRAATDGIMPIDVPGGLPNLPQGADWDKPVRLLFPQYYRPKNFSIS